MSRPATIATIESGDADGNAARRARQAPDCRPINFGRCQALPAARTLLRNGVPVELGSRAFDLLIILLRYRGDIVVKEDIIRHVWPTTFVEESNLRFQVATLRRALAEDRALIKTIPGRGYVMIPDHDPPAGTSVERDEPIRVEPNMPEFSPASGSVIFVVERDRQTRDALSRLLRPLNARIMSFGSFESLLESNDKVRRGPAPGRRDHADAQLAMVPPTLTI